MVMLGVVLPANCGDVVAGQVTMRILGFIVLELFALVASILALALMLELSGLASLMF